MTIVAKMNLPEVRVAVVVSDFNSLVTDRLLTGALNELSKRGVSDGHVTVVRVPGAMEIPRVAKQLSELPDIDGVVTLGAVVRGSTDHYQFVAGETAHGIAEAALTGGAPITFGVLTTADMAAALDRAGGKSGNKGSEAAAALLDMVSVTRQIAEL
ncbi:6,7-dimethyl-8-ribityllumazine synthase [Secundilactobacillus kimchicus]|uniref:6,7-dimethyl-8-ribityllumazine synthase n=1 Tax=Secundilactobacillus kimchicus TaxID=528209 RepID=UPI001C00E9F1|nr:6,7-dimethyl-8-ribityllumazine synthase [Secundilactobacillus kimchicus]MBT9671520.1 6,7-dimethyl-8-ribityllumazine synthase [Secundilactobacillus kimchicus]